MNMLAAAALGLLAGAGLAASPPAAGGQEPASACGADQPAGDCGEGIAGERLAQADQHRDTARQLFERIDRDRDGQITPEEWSVWYDTESAAATASGQGGPAAD
ncbi:MAG: hypothetical protein K0R41_3639 [Geminicoccaceae bacterium]|jgi:hypothetical protein|nr:hypothetical protein [Geminicoccaceae bacterium]MCE3249814.1 hypothetical protein [Geminicoccaceae bacterium]